MIETKDLTKRYRGVLALDRLNLRIGRGEIFGYIGPNGAGKTTTIRILSGLLKATSGQAVIGDVDVTARPRKAKDVVGYLPELFGVYDGMRVWEYLDFFGAAYRLPRKKRAARLEAVMALTGVETMRDYFVDTLSRGMKQRVGIAKTLIHDPEVLFLDEPTSGLDPRARIEIRELLKKLKELGKTILVSSHILPELASVCDRIGILEQGKLLACDSVERVLKQVQPHRIIDIEVLDDPERAADFLRQRYARETLHVENIMGRLVRISFQGGDRQAAELLQGLIAEGIRVLWHTEVTMDLEEIYLSVTRAASAGARRAEDSEAHE